MDGADLGILLGGWGGPGAGDLNGSGVIDGADLGILLGSWGDATCLMIEGIDPHEAAPGTIVVVTGMFPDPDPLNYCLVAMDEAGIAVPFTVIEVTPKAITARVGPVPPTIGKCTLMIGTGLGNEVAAGAGALPIGPGGWAWQAVGSGVSAAVQFAPLQGGHPALFGVVTEGALCTEISGPFPVGTRLRIYPRVHSSGPPHVGYDAYIGCVSITEALDIAGTASRICQAIAAVYAAHEPNPLLIDCSTTLLPDGGARICLALPGTSANWGTFVIEELSPDQLHAECDYDMDGVVDTLDNCIEHPNPSQSDFDGDGIGDACDCPAAGGNGSGLGPAATFSLCCTAQDPFPKTCPGDLNGDGLVDCVDVALMESVMGWWAPCADLNGSFGYVDAVDLAILLSNFGNCFPVNLFEDEPCGKSFNDGCTSDPPQFARLADGHFISATTWAAEGERDTDWYEIVIGPGSRTLKLGTHTQIAMTIGIVNTQGVPLCALATGLDPEQTSPACSGFWMFECLEPGTYWLSASPVAEDGHPCGQTEWRYFLSVELLESCGTCDSPPQPQYTCTSTGATVVTQSVDPVPTHWYWNIWCTLPDTSLETSYARSFINAGAEFRLECAQLGFVNWGSSLLGSLSVYLDLDGGAPVAPGIDLDLVRSIPLVIPGQLGGHGCDCCFARDEPGCSDPWCEFLTCHWIPSCCEIAWDGACAAYASGGGSGSCQDVCPYLWLPSELTASFEPPVVIPPGATYVIELTIPTSPDGVAGIGTNPQGETAPAYFRSGGNCWNSVFVELPLGPWWLPRYWCLTLRGE
ncbi:MAG TPA: hypothetical protein PKC43_12545 [Phycisphaerales bacterium]|nr:hypothetical protein [Phycisphaerales bacterium]HMP38261.1 hypothetical protein [Phycisphaerales bacterium]